LIPYRRASIRDRQRIVGWRNARETLIETWIRRGGPFYPCFVRTRNARKIIT
jgi:hypothetical protein